MTTPMPPDRLEELKRLFEDRGIDDACAVLEGSPNVQGAGQELICEVERQRDEIIGMKEELFIKASILEDDDGWRYTGALTEAMILGDELVALGVYEKDPTRGVGRRGWYRKLESKP